MTANQIAYQNYRENARSNKRKEQETERSNRAQEDLGWYSARETNRHNVAAETETNRSNLAREVETNRSNLARELETNRSNQANEYLKQYDTDTRYKQGVDVAYINKYGISPSDLGYLGSKAGNFVANAVSSPVVKVATGLAGKTAAAALGTVFKSSVNLVKAGQAAINATFSTLRKGK